MEGNMGYEQLLGKWCVGMLGLVFRLHYSEGA
jgi:hypothetical protein